MAPFNGWINWSIRNYLNKIAILTAELMEKKTQKTCLPFAFTSPPQAIPLFSVELYQQGRVGKKMLTMFLKNSGWNFNVNFTETQWKPTGGWRREAWRPADSVLRPPTFSCITQSFTAILSPKTSNRLWLPWISVTWEFHWSPHTEGRTLTSQFKLPFTFKKKKKKVV